MASVWHALGRREAFRHDTLHLSIYGIAETDDLDPVLVQRAQKAPTSLRTAPFSLSFDQLKCFNSHSADYPFVISTDKSGNQLKEIAADLHAACRAMNIANLKSATVTAHVTLAYVPDFSEPQYLESPIYWTIDEVTLIDSLQGQGRHLTLGRWPLPKGRQQGFDF